MGLFYTKRGTPIYVGTKGEPDAYIRFPHNGNLLHIEVEAKAGKKGLSPEQKKWRDQTLKMGGIYILLREENDIVNVIKEKLGLSGKA